MFPQRDALLRLLRDDDPSTVGLVKEQLFQSGPSILPDLRNLLEMDDEKVSAHVSDIISGIEKAQAVATFGVFCRTFGGKDSLEEACWLLSAAIIPHFDAGVYSNKLDLWGRQLTALLQKASSNRERVETLGKFMSEHLAFRGDGDDYYNPRNSFLPFVIDTRSGIPITLCLLYILLAERAGMAVDGVNLPGHFIVRHGEVFFDPFHQGKILSLADCREILTRQNLEIEASHFATAGNVDILVRILVNLHFIYERLGDLEMQAQIHGWLAALDRRHGVQFPGPE